MKYIVYIHTSPEGKKYIGKTKMTPESRWGWAGHGYKENISFYSDIKKFGWHNFQHHITYCNNEYEMNELEKWLIHIYDTTNFNKGYNRAQIKIIYVWSIQGLCFKNIFQKT